jgi:hypothetical protein
MKSISQKRSGAHPAADPSKTLNRPAREKRPDANAVQIKVSCDTGDFLPLNLIVEFQGEFKKRDQYDIKNIIKSLSRYGISFPFFIWQNQGINYCLDGHGRKTALQQLQDHGCAIPDIPVVYVYAKDREEAVQKLLRLNSRYGAITEDSVTDFIRNTAVDLCELSIPDIDNIEFADIPKYLDGFFSDKEPPKEKAVKRCPYCGGILN